MFEGTGCKKQGSSIKGHKPAKYWGFYWDNGKENGNYYSIIGYLYIYIKGHMATTIPPFSPVSSLRVGMKEWKGT